MYLSVERPPRWGHEETLSDYTNTDLSSTDQSTASYVDGNVDVPLLPKFMGTHKGYLTKICQAVSAELNIYHSPQCIRNHARWVGGIDGNCMGTHGDAVGVILNCAYGKWLK